MHYLLADLKLRCLLVTGLGLSWLNKELARNIRYLYVFYSGVHSMLSGGSISSLLEFMGYIPEVIATSERQEAMFSVVLQSVPVLNFDVHSFDPLYSYRCQGGSITRRVLSQ